MNSKLLISLILSIALVMSLASASSITFNKPNQPSFSEPVEYDIDVNSPVENIASLDVYFYDSSNNIVGLTSDIGNRSHGVFSAPQSGDYSIYVLVNYVDGTSEYDEIFFTVKNDLRILGYLNPTPENNDVINSNNIDSSKIVALINTDADSFRIFIENESDSWNYPVVGRQSDLSLIDLYNVDLFDGLYSFYAEATLGEVSDRTPMRQIRIDASIPNATDINFTNIPSSIDEDVSFSFDLTLNVSEQPVTVRVIATGNAGNKALGSHLLTNYSGESLSFGGAIPNPGFYNIVLSVSDEYGNSNRYTLSNITVNDVADPVVEPRRRGGRGGNNDNEVINATNKTEYNLQKIDLNEEKSVEKETNETQETEESKPGVFSFITGAVTGAFSTPPRAILTFIILIVIIYAIVKIRGYLVTENPEDKPKKNGKKSKKEDSEESDSE